MALPKKSPWSIWVMRANAYANKGEYKLAIDDMNHAVELSSDNAAVYSVRGGIYARMGDLDRAEADVARASKLDPVRCSNEKELFSHRRRYLKEINDEGDFENWSGPPLSGYKIQR